MVIIYFFAVIGILATLFFLISLAAYLDIKREERKQDHIIDFMGEKRRRRKVGR